MTNKNESELSKHSLLAVPVLHADTCLFNLWMKILVSSNWSFSIFLELMYEWSFEFAWDWYNVIILLPANYVQMNYLVQYLSVYRTISNLYLLK